MDEVGITRILERSVSRRTFIEGVIAAGAIASEAGYLCRVGEPSQQEGPMGVRLLVGLAALMLLVSGLVKLRAAERVGLGLAVLPLVEVATALALLGVSLFRSLGVAGGLTAVLASLLLLLGSSLQVGIAIRRRRRSRELSEGARLRTYVQYLSWPVDPEEGPSRRQGGPRR